MTETTKPDQESLDAVLDAVAGDFLKALGPIAKLPEEMVDEVAAAMLLVSAAGEDVSEDDIGVAIEWLRKFTMQAAMIQFILSGASDVSVVDGEIAVRMRSPERFMERCIATGITKPVGVG